MHLLKYIRNSLSKKLAISVIYNVELSLNWKAINSKVKKKPKKKNHASLMWHRIIILWYDILYFSFTILMIIFHSLLYTVHAFVIRKNVTRSKIYLNVHLIYKNKSDLKNCKKEVGGGSTSLNKRNYNLVKIFTSFTFFCFTILFYINFCYISCHIQFVYCF